MEWEKIFANAISYKGLLSKIYKELIKLNTLSHKEQINKQIIQLRNGQKTLGIDTFPKKTSRWLAGI